MNVHQLKRVLARKYPFQLSPSRNHWNPSGFPGSDRFHHPNFPSNIGNGRLISIFAAVQRNEDVVPSRDNEAQGDNDQCNVSHSETDNVERVIS